MLVVWTEDIEDFVVVDILKCYYIITNNAEIERLMYQEQEEEQGQEQQQQAQAQAQEQK